VNNIDIRNEKYLTYDPVSGFLLTSSLGTVFIARPPTMIKY
jgi:hypothetical protein